MARKMSYAIEKGGPKRLELTWTGIWKNIQVSLDGQSLGEPIPNMAALKQGREFRLPDGRPLNVIWKNKFGAPGLELTLDGKPLPGSANDPRQAIKMAAILLWVIAGLSLAMGLVLASIAGVRLHGSDLALMIGQAVVFVVLGFLVWKYRSRAALLVAIILYIADAVWSLAVLMDAGGKPPTSGLVIRVFITIALIRGYTAVSAANRLEKAELVDTFE